MLAYIIRTLKDGFSFASFSIRSISSLASKKNAEGYIKLASIIIQYGNSFSFTSWKYSNWDRYFTFDYRK